jgi:hypothetical protein
MILKKLSLPKIDRSIKNNLDHYCLYYTNFYKLFGEKWMRNGESGRKTEDGKRMGNFEFLIRELEFAIGIADIENWRIPAP